MLFLKHTLFVIEELRLPWKHVFPNPPYGQTETLTILILYKIDDKKPISSFKYILLYSKYKISPCSEKKTYVHFFVIITPLKHIRPFLLKLLNSLFIMVLYTTFRNIWPSGFRKVKILKVFRQTDDRQHVVIKTYLNPRFRWAKIV